MICRTHVVGDAIVQTCGKAGRVFTKWARRMPNVPCAVPASWTSWPQGEEHHEYGYAGKDAWANEKSQRYMQEMDEVLHQGITNELHQAVLERTWKRAGAWRTTKMPRCKAHHSQIQWSVLQLPFQCQYNGLDAQLCDCQTQLSHMQEEAV
jgi:hypothetical protein